jgi:hypothetical protein
MSLEDNNTKEKKLELQFTFSFFPLLLLIGIGWLIYNYEPQIKGAYQQYSAQAEPEVLFEGTSKEDLKSEVSRINLILDKHEKSLLEKKPDIPNGPAEECKCGGTGKIVQGDGHTTDCTCPKPCSCKKTASEFLTEQPMTRDEMKEFINQAVTEAFNNYVKEYRERAAAQQAEQQQSFQPQPQTVEQMP